MNSAIKRVPFTGKHSIFKIEPQFVKQVKLFVISAHYERKATSLFLMSCIFRQIPKVHEYEGVWCSAT